MKAVKKHAEQYITNIQLDIDEIDDEIEEILLQTEDANYNVAQGYKVFKRLKELRIERKEKEKGNETLKQLMKSTDNNEVIELLRKHTREELV